MLVLLDHGLTSRAGGSALSATVSAVAADGRPRTWRVAERSIPADAPPARWLTADTLVLAAPETLQVAALLTGRRGDTLAVARAAAGVAPGARYSVRIQLQDAERPTPPPVMLAPQVLAAVPLLRPVQSTADPGSARDTLLITWWRRPTPSTGSIDLP